jgi:predicted dehydrogenase
MERYKVIIIGCDGRGRKTAQVLLDKTSFESVGAVDIDPELFGKD